MADPRPRTFLVTPNLPQRLKDLRSIAYNLWWSWHHDAIALFRRLDEERFEANDHSPIKLLGDVDQSRFEQLAQDEGFLAHLYRVGAALAHYMSAPTWFSNTFKDSNLRVAYFSMEFGIHESIPIYSGGLGILAGDHLKSASDLGLPLVGVSLMYRQGYFRQYLNLDGWQQELYPENDFYNLPLIADHDRQGMPLMISVPFPGREVMARVWRIQVGRVPLLLLDTNVPQNSKEDREITCQLYGGDQENRIKQEIVLGIGGYRALRALNLVPTVCHMNEGHSAFLALERIRYMVEEVGFTFCEAMEAVTASNVFTTHTPVPAGNDAFPPSLFEKYLGYYAPLFKIDRQQLLGLGRQVPSDDAEYFGMTVLALKLSNASNGVSQLHGVVSRKMWKGLWPDLPNSDVPIGAITNGVHLAGWMSSELTQLMERYLGAAFAEKPADPRVWKKVDNLPDAELWRSHERAKEQLIMFARSRLKQQLKKRGASKGEIDDSDEVLNPEALTIGFARRSATYKRGTLIFKDLERLARLVNQKERPIQIIFAGKAHPHDKGGKELIQRMAQVAKMPEFRRRIAFLEDYDINVARMLVHGVDVWLNNPRRPLEASGTSGMKVVANGGLHLSVLDGWWAEGYNGSNGFAIGAGEEYADLSYQDEVESRALYETLEKSIIPIFFDRTEDNVPRKWMQIVKQSMRTLCPFFNTNRMVEDYMRYSYDPSHRRVQSLLASGGQPLREFVQWKARELKAWSQIKVEAIETSSTDRLMVGDRLTVKSRVQLAGLSPDDVDVQIYHGVVDALDTIQQPHLTPMTPQMALENGAYLYAGEFPCSKTGQYGFIVRVLPKHALLNSPYATGLVRCG